MRGTTASVRSRRGNAPVGRGFNQPAGCRQPLRALERAKLPARTENLARGPGGECATLTVDAARPAKPTARPRLGAHPAPMLVDPCLGVGFGFEYAYRSWTTARDIDLDTKPVVKRDDAIRCLRVRVCSGHVTRRDRELDSSKPRPDAVTPANEVGTRFPLRRRSRSPCR